MLKSFVRAAICTGLVLAAIGPLTLQAQSTFDGDVTASGHKQVALDMLSYVGTHAEGGWTWFYPRAYRGFAHDVEVGAALSAYDHQANGGSSAFIPSIKWRALRDTTHRFQIATGAQSLIATQHGIDTYGLAFVSFDKALPQTERTAGSIAVGRYTLIGRDAVSTDTRQGTIVSAWEAVGAIRFSGSWFSGRNWYGYKTGTVTYTTSTGQWVAAGYSQGNSAFHNSGPYVSMGKAF